VTRTVDRVIVELAEGHARGLSFYGWTGQCEPFSYPQVLERSLACGAALQEMGLRPGERVALIASTTPASIFALLGIWLAGGIPSCLPPIVLGRLADYQGTTSRMLAAFAPSLILTDLRTRRALAPVVAEQRPRLGLHAVDGLPTASRAWVPVESRPSDIALIQFSSGTTVDPKPVALGHEGILHNVRAMLARYLTPYDQLSGVSWLPLYHDMGLIGALLSALFTRADLALLQPEHFAAKPFLWLDVLSRTRATVSGGPNFAYGLCVSRVSDEELEGLDLSQWKIALAGAEHVQASTLRQFAKRMAVCGFSERAFTPAYGLAEATLGVSIAVPGRPLKTCALPAVLDIGTCVDESRGGRTYVSVGTPLPDIDVEIRDADQRPLPERHVGRIWVSSPSLMAGYWARPEETEKVLSGGRWLDSGDLGVFVDGELFIYGRAKDVVIINGRNHDPAFIEESLDGVADLAASRVVAFSYVDEARHTELLCVLAEHVREPRSSLEAVAAAAREAIIRRTGLVPDCLGVVAPGVLPRTTSGKIQRFSARAAWQDGTLVPVVQDLRPALRVHPEGGVRS
jgi:fatty-acyl-CoA synthase